MTTIQPSMDSSSSSLADWLAEAVGLVQRVNARLLTERKPATHESGSCDSCRKVLTDQRCLELAALVDSALES